MSLLFYITFAENDKSPFEFNIKKEELTWESLTHSIIQFHSTTCVDLPIVLYYKFNSNINILESQSQLEELLYQNKDNKPMHLFDTKEITDTPVFKVESIPVEMSAFSRLGQLIDNHKKIISSSRHLSKCVGILASAIALDTYNKDFDKEFKALEKVIESRKEDYTTNKPSTIDRQSKEALKHLFESHRPKKREHHGRGRGRGGFYTGRGHFHHHHHHHHGDPADFFYAATAAATAEGKHQKTQACFRGRHGSSSSEGSSSSAEEENMEALQSKMRNLHIKKYHHLRDKKGGGGRDGFF